MAGCFESMKKAGTLAEFENKMVWPTEIPLVSISFRDEVMIQSPECLSGPCVVIIATERTEISHVPFATKQFFSRRSDSTLMLFKCM